MNDPYGVDLALDPTGDLVVTHSGELATVSGPYTCAQAILVRLRTSPGELPLHPEYGTELAGSEIGAKQDIGGLASQLNADLRTMLNEDQRFVTANVIEIQQPATTGLQGSARFTIRAQLSAGEQLTLGTGSDPSPIDVSLPQFVDPNVDPTLTYDDTSEQEFFADQSEFDQLADLNTMQSLIDDIPGLSITQGG